jgi:hypothetical protein
MIDINRHTEFPRLKEVFERKFPLVTHAFENEYGWPEMDTLRHEACLCIAFDLNQAAITLCNHLLESLLKYSLIYFHSIKNKENVSLGNTEIIALIAAFTEEGIRKYGDMQLSRTIDEAHGLGLLDDAEKDMLHQFRRNFRNAYSHADKQKTFGAIAIPVQSAKIGSGQIVTGIPVEAKVAELPIIHSIAQAMKATEDAPDYFLYLDELVRRLKERVFPIS